MLANAAMTTPARYDVAILGAHCVTPNGARVADIGVCQGKIAFVGNIDKAHADQCIEAHGLTALPGVIDSQVHFREPGLEHKEDLATGTLAALLGGVTAVFEMPNTNPSTTTQAAFEDKVARTKGRVFSHVGFFIGACAENADQLASLERLPGCVGVKVFMGSSTGSLLVDSDALLEEVLRHGSRRVAIHGEDEPRLSARRHLVDGFSPHVGLHPVWRDEETALLATQRCLRLARAAGRRVHILHVTTRQEMALLARYKDLATVEVTPQHLSLAAPECYDRLGSFAQMNPPIRGVEHQQALWQAVADGTVDVIGSDHAPHTREEKQRAYPKSPSGMPGVQTIVPLMLNHVNAGRLSIERLVDLLCAAPARIYNLPNKGALAPGFDADITLVDMQARRTIEDAQMASRCGWTPFAGVNVTGWPQGVLLGGHVAMWEGEAVGPARGQMVAFADADSSPS